MPVRRVVTGHDPSGVARVMIDDVCPGEEIRPGARAHVIWSSEGFPVVQDVDEDRGAGVTATSLEDGTAFRVVEYAPGVSGRVHRTSSLDYAMVLKGQIHMQMDGSEIVLNAGDVLVQRGTIHNWVNRSDQPCTVAFVLISAKPVEVGGRRLDETG